MDHEPGERLELLEPTSAPARRATHEAPLAWLRLEHEALLTGELSAISVAALDGHPLPE